MFRKISPPLGLIALALIAGCGARPPASTLLPASAKLEATSKGSLATRTTDSGTLYIINATTNHLIYSGHVNANQMVEIDSSTDQIFLDSKVIATPTLSTDDQYQLFIDPTALK